MRLVASLIVHNEISRYLESCIDSLLEFCDEVRVVDDNSTDGTAKWLMSRVRDGVRPLVHQGSSFYDHEGRARQNLLDWTLKGNPTHIITVDGDEFLTDGPALRAVVKQEPEVLVWTMPLLEVWNASSGGLSIRVDGGWRVGSAQLYRAPSETELRRQGQQWRILDQALACGRNPLAIRRLPSKSSGVSLLHFGWTNQSERDKRYQRYVEHDNGNFHARRHLDSIMWPDDKVLLQHRSWPDGLLARRESILSRVDWRSV